MHAVYRLEDCHGVPASFAAGAVADVVEATFVRDHRRRQWNDTNGCTLLVSVGDKSFGGAATTTALTSYCEGPDISDKHITRYFTRYVANVGALFQAGFHIDASDDLLPFFNAVLGSVSATPFHCSSACREPHTGLVVGAVPQLRTKQAPWVWDGVVAVQVVATSLSASPSSPSSSQHCDLLLRVLHGVASRSISANAALTAKALCEELQRTSSLDSSRHEPHLTVFYKSLPSAVLRRFVVQCLSAAQTVDDGGDDGGGRFLLCSEIKAAIKEIL